MAEIFHAEHLFSGIPGRTAQNMDPREDPQVKAFFALKYEADLYTELPEEEIKALLDMTDEQLYFNLQKTYKITVEEATAICKDHEEQFYPDKSQVE